MGRIQVMNGKYRGALITVPDGEPLLIGRDVHRCQLVLEPRWVSRIHLIIRYDGESDSYLVTDWSKCGTYDYNGMRLPEKREVSCARHTALWIGENGIEILLE